MNPPFEDASPIMCKKRQRHASTCLYNLNTNAGHASALFRLRPRARHQPLQAIHAAIRDVDVQRTVAGLYL